MNAEALVGKDLGACTLQQVIGQGSMGTVYLAQQSRPYRKVAVKVFLRASTLDPFQYKDFLERFRREVDAVASLEHPNILSIFEDGERDGFVYLVMPYVDGPTLEDTLKRQGMLPYSKVLNYLDQLAAALDYAHGRGVLHRDVKPANILVTADERLLLTDFALSKVMTDEQATQVRQFNVGMLDYMAPEQVMGKAIDERADLYSLGAVLYYMVTGTAPFQGETLTEVAKKHLMSPPPLPGSKRLDLPVAAEQAMLRALAKRAATRYAHAQDLATAFRLALAVTQTSSEHTQENIFSSSGITGTAPYSSHDLFDLKLRPGIMPTVNSEQTTRQFSHVLPVTATASTPLTGVLAGVKKTVLQPEREGGGEKTPLPLPVVFPDPITPAQDTPMFPEATTSASGILAVPKTEQANTDAIIKLTGPVKIVTVPVAGQPGRYVTGFLPILPAIQKEVKNSPIGTAMKHLGTNVKHRLQKRFQIIALLVSALLVLGTGIIWIAHLHSSSAGMAPRNSKVVGTPDVRASMTAQAVAQAIAQATATANANIILRDPLSQNIHNWPLVSTGLITYVFKDGAYHITDNDNTRGAPAILPDLVLTDPFVYTLTMEEIKGDDTSVNNEFGMIIRANIQNKNGKAVNTFYTFEVLNKPGGEYQFWKYDDSQGTGVNPWKKLGQHAFGSEFHQGQGPNSINTFKIIANGQRFTLLVNGKQVWTVQDSSFASGSIGMLVNLKGTEVAFSNLELTHS